MENTYTLSMLAHVNGLEFELNELHAITIERKLNQFEYRAAERTLQIVIEASIGISKHWCKQLQGTAPASAYQAFDNLESMGIVSVKLTNWKQIIGLRNALVHDYLNIDPTIIEQLIKDKNYLSVIAFSRLGLKALSETG